MKIGFTKYIQLEYFEVWDIFLSRGQCPVATYVMFSGSNLSRVGQVGIIPSGIYSQFDKNWTGQKKGICDKKTISLFTTHLYIDY